MNNIKDMLEACNFPTEGRKIMLVRHSLKEEKAPMRRFIKASPDNFAEWQCVQSKDTKKGGVQLLGCHFVMAFCGVKGAGLNARFAGMFRNFSGNKPDTLDVDKHLSPELAKIYHDKGDTPAGRFFFDFRKEPLFADWEGRVIIDWDEHFYNWVREFSPDNPKKVLEITRESVAPFCDQ